jgi:hypothetical protein
MKIVDSSPPSSPTSILAQTTIHLTKWRGDNKEAQALTTFPWEISADLAVRATAHHLSTMATDTRVLVEVLTEASSVVAVP